MSFMLDEIEQQPQVLERTLRREVKAIERFRRRIEGRAFSMVVLVARGTSDNAALFGRYLIETTVGLPTSLAAPSVTTLYGAKPNWSDALVVGLSQSGESTDTNLCLQAAREQGALTVGITNEPGSSITKCVDELFQVHAGRERSVAATKTYTGQLLVLYLLAYALGAPIPPRVLERLPAVAARALSVKKSVEALSERYRFMTNTVVVGRGLNYATAYEFSLKMMETCYVVAERFSDADFLHGPIALVGKGFPVFVFAPPGPTQPGVTSILAKLRGLEAETIVIGHGNSQGNEAQAGDASRHIRLPGSIPKIRGCPDDLLTPIPYIIPAQLFTASLAKQKGIDPDQPRTLTKITKTI